MQIPRVVEELHLVTAKQCLFTFFNSLNATFNAFRRVLVSFFTFFFESLVAL